MSGASGSTSDGPARERVLRAVIEVATQHGYHGTTVQRVADGARLPADEVAAWWPDRVEMLRDALELAWQDWQAEVPTFRPQDHGPAPDLRTEVQRRLTQGLHGGRRAAHFWRLGLLLRLEPALAGTGCSDLFADVRRRTLEALRAYWRGVLPDDVDPRVVELAVRGHLALADGGILATSGTPEWDLEQMMAFVARGIAAIVEHGSIYADMPGGPGSDGEDPR